MGENYREGGAAEVETDVRECGSPNGRGRLVTLVDQCHQSGERDCPSRASPPESSEVEEPEHPVANHVGALPDTVINVEDGIRTESREEALDPGLRVS